MSKSTKSASPSGAERRKSKRLDVLETFSLFAVVPAKGPMRLKVHDVSDAGIGFDLDIAEENGIPAFEAKQGASFDIHLYLNQSLFIPLTVVIRRIAETDGIRRIGAEIEGKATKGQIALAAFLDMLDVLSDVARIEG